MLRPCQEVPGPAVRTHRFKPFVFDQSDQKEDRRCRLVRRAEKWGLGRLKGVFSPFQMCLLYYEGSAETNTVPILQASQDNSEGL